MNLSDKLTTLHLGSIEFNQVPLGDALDFLRHLAHDIEPDVVETPVLAWGVPVSHLLPAGLVRSLRVSLHLENPTLLDALLRVAEAVGCSLHVNPTGCFVLPPACKAWLPTVSRGAQGEPILRNPSESYIPGIPDESAPAEPAPEAIDIIQQAFEEALPPLALVNEPVEAAVEVLRTLTPGVPMVVCNPAGDELPSVTLNYLQGTTLGEVLASLAEAAGMDVLYQRTGVILYLPSAVAIHLPGAELA